MPITAAVAIPAAATIGSAALSTAGGLFSNKTNKKIARETNALNYKMFQEANAFNEEMWNKTNLYNSPLNQRRLLEEAGYNPASLLDAPSLGAASQAPGSVTPPQMQGWNYQNVLANVGSDLVAFTQAAKNAQEAKNVDLQNKNYEWKLTEEIDLMRKQGMLSEANADKIKQDFDLTEASWDDLMKHIHANAYLTQEQANIANLQHDILKTYGHVSAEANLDKLCAEAYKLIQEGKYTDAARALMPAELSLKQAMVVIEDYKAKTDRMVGSAAARELSARAAGEEIANQLNSIFGENERWVELGRKISEGKIKDSEAFLAELDKYLYKKDNLAGKLAKGSRWLGEVITNVLPLFKRIKF